MSDLSYLPKYVKMINYKISVKSIKYPIAFKERIMKLRRLLILSCIGVIGAMGISQAIEVNIPGAHPDIRCGNTSAYSEPACRRSGPDRTAPWR